MIKAFICFFSLIVCCVKSPTTTIYASSLEQTGVNSFETNATYMGDDSNVNTIGAITPGALPCIGSPRILVFYTDFKNGATNWSKTKAEVEQMFFSEEGKKDSILAYSDLDSLRSYYYRSSYGKVDIVGDVYEYQTKNDTSYYSSVNMVLDEIIEYYCEEIDWNQYDSNNDGYLDGVYVIARNNHSFGGSSFVGSYANSVDNKKICKACFLDDEMFTTMCHETCHMFGPADMYANVCVNPSGIQTACIMDKGYGDLPSPTKFVLGWLDNVKFVNSNNIGDYSLRSYTNHPDALVVYPNGDYTNKNWFFTEYVTSEGNNLDAQNGIRIWKTQMNVDDNYNIVGSDKFCNGMPSSPYEYLEAIHPDNVWNYYMKKGDSITPYTYPSTSFSNTFYLVGGAKYLSNLTFSGISIKFTDIVDGTASVNIDIAKSADHSLNFTATMELVSPKNSSTFLDTINSIHFATISSDIELKLSGNPLLRTQDGNITYSTECKMSANNRSVNLFISPKDLVLAKEAEFTLSNLNLTTYYGDVVTINTTEEMISFSDFPMPLKAETSTYYTGFQMSREYNMKPYKISDSLIMSIYYDNISNKLYWGEYDLYANITHNYELDLPNEIVLSSDINNDNISIWQDGEYYFVYIKDYICCFQNKVFVASLKTDSGLRFCGADNNSFFVNINKSAYYELVFNDEQISLVMLESLNDYYIAPSYPGSDFNIFSFKNGQYVICLPSQITFVDIKTNTSREYTYINDNEHGQTRSTVRYLDGKYYVFASSVDLMMYVYDESFEIVNEVCLLKALSSATWGPFGLNVCYENNQWIIYFESVSNSNAISYASTFLATFSKDGAIVYYYRYGDASYRYCCSIVPLSDGRFVGITAYSFFYINKICVEHEFKNYISNGNGTHSAICECGAIDTKNCSGGTATCTDQKVCTECGAPYGSSLGHDLVHHEGKDPTCTEIGWEEYDTCSHCDYTTYTELPATGHTPATPVEENRVEATCTTDGHYDSVVYCSVCGEELSREEKTLTKLGHDLVHHEGKDPTCTEIGWEEYDTCSHCDYTTYTELPATGHTPATYAQTFLTDLGSVCDAGGNSDIADLQLAWASLALDFDALSNADKQIFTQGTADSSGDEVNQALALYDYIATKYGTQLESEACPNFDFMSRGITQEQSNNRILLANNSQNSISLIVIATVVMSGLIIGYFTLKKRKEQ